MKAKISIAGKKELIRSVIIMGLVFVTLTVSAFNSETLIYVSGDKIITKSSNAKCSIIKVKDTPRRIKDISIETDQETEIAIEKWMFDVSDKFWNGSEEEEIALEEWMFNINDSFWYGSGNENEIPVENWMLDLASWK
ncbi:MAG: hypothetical protein JW894_00170 [Bacteroidales bacterium]|nr:hypothetical protein [Bacteroidales bacterium]